MTPYYWHDSRFWVSGHFGHRGEFFFHLSYFAISHVFFSRIVMRAKSPLCRTHDVRRVIKNCTQKQKKKNPNDKVWRTMFLKWFFFLFFCIIKLPKQNARRAMRIVDCVTTIVTFVGHDIRAIFFFFYEPTSKNTFCTTACSACRGFRNNSIHVYIPRRWQFLFYFFVLARCIFFSFLKSNQKKSTVKR